MSKRSLAVLALIAILLPAPGFGKSRTRGVVFAITSAEQPDWALMFGNLRNLGKGMPGVRMEVVVYGPAVGLLRRGSAVAADVEALEQQGVAFVACENSLRRMDLAAAELLAGVGTVPSGIVEVVRRQQEGWAYIKAGR